MKVREDRAPIQDIIHGQGMQGRKGTADVAAPFESVYQEKVATGTHDTLNRLLERINEQGEVLARSKDVSDVKRYRELVTDFLHEALNSTYRSDKEGSFDSRGRYKEYSVVRKVNTELEGLTTQVLSDQKDKLKILEHLGTIRGLLIDLMV